MSEKSFAVASISVAIVWGTFFYPPMPNKANRTGAVVPVSADVTVDRLRADKGALLRPTNPPIRPVALNTATTLPDCAFASPKAQPGCAPLHKLAGK